MKHWVNPFQTTWQLQFYSNWIDDSCDNKRIYIFRTRFFTRYFKIQIFCGQIYFVSHLNSFWGALFLGFFLLLCALATLKGVNPVLLCTALLYAASAKIIIQSNDFVDNLHNILYIVQALCSNWALGTILLIGWTLSKMLWWIAPLVLK